MTISYINLSSGKLTRPNFKQGDQTITLTPTYTVGELTLTGDPIRDIVLKAAEAADIPLEPVYLMDFSPDTDGEFYDFPQGTPGRTQVTRIEIPENAEIFSGHTAVDNKCIALDSEDNVSKIMPNTRTINEYIVFSKGSADGDVNTGASGAVDDYCLKMIDSGTKNSAPSVNISFPEAYGKPTNDNDYVKYRFEIDYKWQQFSDLTTTTANTPTGTTWLRFYFGESTMNLYSKSSAETAEASEANGNSALCFTSNAFGMGATTNQRVPAGETGTVTAPMVSGKASGQWVHITVDFDFEDGTIDAVIEGNENTRKINTVIPDGTGIGGASFKSLFMEGLTGVSILGSTGGNLRAIWADNIKISPMQTIKKTPSEKLNDANNPPTAFDDIKGENTDEDNVTENLNLISKKGDADVTWSILPASASKFVNVSSGLITRPSHGEGSQSVSLTPTYTVAGRTLVGEPIAVVIAAMPESAQERIERIIADSPFVFDDIKGSNAASTAVTSDLGLPQSVEGDISVSWSVLPNDMAELVDTATGKVTRPKYTDGDKTIELVPIYKLEDIEITGKAIKVTIIKNSLDTSSAAIQDAYAITADDLVQTGESPESVRGNLILPNTGKIHGSRISWSATPLIVNTKNGTVKRPFGASKMNVVLTATVTNGDETAVREFDITVVDSNYGSGSSSSGGTRGGGGGGVAYTGNAEFTENTLPNEGDTAPSSTVFNDIDNVEWAKDYIIELYELGVINGDGNGMFSPDRHVTREEFVKMLLLAFAVEIDVKSQDAFDDVAAGSWFEPYVATAYRLKLVNGISGTEFGTGDSITRQDVAAMIVRCLEYKGITLDASEDYVHFRDEAEISGYAREAVKNLREAGILTGDDNYNFNPEFFATRAEVAKVLGMLIKADQE
ncbi:MAG: S-layer homology domain-containing protein, partial [Clostridia bacterium]|nr:S-layer homology domain-containing protein [Clostridia bacterium]